MTRRQSDPMFYNLTYFDEKLNKVKPFFDCKKKQN